MSSTDSRVKKSLLNARVNLIFYFLVLILSFFSRKIFSFLNKKTRLRKSSLKKAAGEDRKTGFPGF